MQNNKKLSEIDSNFRDSGIIPDNTLWLEGYDGPFEINGLYNPKELKKYTRLPDKFKYDITMNDGAKALIHHTAGGRIRFATNSPYVAVSVELSNLESSNRFAPSGQCGMDFYMCKKGSSDYRYRKNFAPCPVVSDEFRFYSGIAYFEHYDLSGEKEFEVMLHLPLYNGINSIKIGLMPGCEIYPPVKYTDKPPILFYGASITQGGCASRPGNNYPNHISRWLNCDFINLGFSGSARGEDSLADYIASMNISALFADLDMSINDIEIFKNTHYNFYKRVREKNRDLPIIFMSMPKYPKIEVNAKKFRNYVASDKIIRATIEKGLSSDDKNLYYIDGEELFGQKDQDACTVDFCHPNDLGFLRMAEGILPVIKKAIGL